MSTLSKKVVYLLLLVGAFKSSSTSAISVPVREPCEASIRHGNLVVYDLQDLPALVFLVLGATPDIFNTWHTLVASEISRRVGQEPLSSRCSGSGSEVGHDVGGMLSDSDIDADMFGADSASVSSDNMSRRMPSMNSLDFGNRSADQGNPGAMSIRWPEALIHHPQSAQESSSSALGSDSFSTLMSLERQDFEKHVRGLQHSELVKLTIKSVGVVKHLQVEKGHLKQQLKTSRQAVRRLKAKHAAFVEKTKHSSEKSKVESLQVEKRGSRLTFRGSVALGVRKAMGLISASSFPLASLVDSSRWTVTRAEVNTWALLIARSRSFHDAFASLLSYIHQRRSHAASSMSVSKSNAVVAVDATPHPVFVPQGNRMLTQSEAIMLDCNFPLPESLSQKDAFLGYNVGAIFFSGDATNAAIWQRQKLQGLETTTSVLVSIDALMNGDLNNAFLRFRQMSFDQRSIRSKVLFSANSLLGCYSCYSYSWTIGQLSSFESNQSFQMGPCNKHFT